MYISVDSQCQFVWGHVDFVYVELTLVPEEAYLAVQLASDNCPVSCIVCFIVDSEAGCDVACQPVQANIGQQEVLAVGHLAVGAPSV